MNPARLIHILSEVVILVLGCLLAFLSTTRRFALPSNAALWVALGALLIIWGLRVWVRRGRATHVALALRWVRGVSLVLAGAAMIAMIWLPFSRAPLLLGIVGVVLAVRGLVAASLATRMVLR